jgi:hypothetical protein
MYGLLLLGTGRVRRTQAKYMKIYCLAQNSPDSEYQGIGNMWPRTETTDERIQRETRPLVNPDLNSTSPLGLRASVSTSVLIFMG